jgi:hypothetical protein
LGTDGLLFTPASELPVATDTVLGGVKVGAGLSVDAAGVLSSGGGITNPVAGSVANMKLWTGTQAQYDALTKDPLTIYHVTA